MSRRGVEPPIAASADRLWRSIVALIGEDCVSGDRLGIAVSGGPDSVALLLLAHRAFPGRVEAASVDHRLRAEAAAECAFVANLCQHRGIPHRTLTPDAPPVPPSQAGARTLRYALLEAWRVERRLDWLLTAHHADDQLETLIMRLNRSSGLHGLAGVRPRQRHILRPLLDWRRSDLAAVLRDEQVIAITDPSNSDPRYDRAQLRLAMTEQSLIDPLTASASAAHLAAAAEALDWAVEKLAVDRIRSDAGATLLDTHDLPGALLQQLVTRIIMANRDTPPRGERDTPPRGEDVARLIDRLQRGQQATLGTQLIVADRAQPALWRFTEAPPRRMD